MMVLFTRCRSLNHAVQFLQNRLQRTICGYPVVARTASSTSRTTGNQIEKVVYVSSSKNIFENLALEEWLYENVDMTDRDCLLLWRNGPAVVIGRHQNPWLECNTEAAADCGAVLARRNSGGGAVYHDEGTALLVTECSSARGLSSGTAQ